MNVLLFAVAISIPLSRQVFANVTDDKRFAFLKGQSDAIKRLRSALNTLKGAPQTPIGDTISIYQWAEWTEKNIDRALEGRSVQPPPGSICSAYSVPVEVVKSFVQDTVAVTQEKQAKPDYEKVYSMELGPRHSVLRDSFEQLEKHAQSGPDFGSAKEKLAKVNERASQYEQYYRLLSQSLETLIDFPEYFTSRQAVLCWFTIEESIIRDLERIQHITEEASARLGDEEAARRDFLSNWIDEHKTALEIERADIEIQLIIVDARKEELQANMEAIEQLNREREVLAEQKQRMLVLQQAAQIDLQNLETEVAEYRSLRSGIVQNINQTRRLINQPYNRCPNGNTYSECTHDQLKQQWQTDQRNAQDRLKTQISDLSNLDSRTRNADERRQILNRDLQGVGDDISHIENDLESIKSQAQQVREDMSNLLFGDSEAADTTFDLAEIEYANQAERARLATLLK
jgi:chromosome segregation ATPase